MINPSERALDVLDKVTKDTGSSLEAAVTAEREPFKELAFFTPFSATIIASLVKMQDNAALAKHVKNIVKSQFNVNESSESPYESFKLATQSLYRAVYQVVGTLALAMTNSYALIDLREGIEVVKDKFSEYQDIMESAKEISQKVDSVFDGLIDSPINVDFCERVKKLVDEYTEKIEIPLLRDKEAKWKDVVRVNYGFTFHYEDIDTVDKMIEFLSGKRYMVNEPSLGLRVADVNIQLGKGLLAGEEAMFRQHFFNFEKNYQLEQALTPIRLLIEGDIIYDYKTIFARYLNQIKANLMEKFETKTIEADGVKMLVYCLKMYLPGQKQRLLRPD